MQRWSGVWKGYLGNPTLTFSGYHSCNCFGETAEVVEDFARQRLEEMFRAFPPFAQPSGIWIDYEVFGSRRFCCFLNYVV